MGMYTEIYVNVDLKQDVPEHILNVLREMCSGQGEGRLDAYPQRWGCLFSSNSFYTPLTECASLTFNEIRGGWSLLGKGDIKNYNREIELFFEWISPWVYGDPGDFIGYHRYEEQRVPTLVFLPQTSKESS